MSNQAQDNWDLLRKTLTEDMARDEARSRHGADHYGQRAYAFQLILDTMHVFEFGLESWRAANGFEVPGLAERTAAVARVVARGSDPAAIEEAEGDFGPGGLFADTSVPGLAEHTAAAPDLPAACTCEYQSHFNGFGHGYQQQAAGMRKTAETGPICDECADTHYAEFVIALDESTAAACDTITKAAR